MLTLRFNRTISLIGPFHRTGVKKIGHPSVAKVPPVAIEVPADSPRKRKGDEVVAPTEGVKRTKGDDVVTVSDDPAVAPSEPPTAAEVASRAKEGVESQHVVLAGSPDVAEPTPSGAAAATTIFPLFMVKAATSSALVLASQLPGAAETEVEQRHGHTPVVLASV